MKNFSKKRAVVLLTAVALLLAVAVGGTVAYLVASTGEVVNTFTPTETKIEIHEEFPDKKVKKNVWITNTGDIPAYVRVRVVVTWQDANGNVYGVKPEVNKDYTITWGTDGSWNQYTTEGFCYHAEAVAPNGGTTGVLFTECKPVGSAPEGYYLNVDILAQAIQATPASAVNEAWGVQVVNGKISK